jgi:hypothetical protein
MPWVMDLVGNSFWNRNERRLRAGWRVALYSMLWGTIQVAATGVIQSPLTAAFIAIFPAFSPIAGVLLFYIANALLVISMTWLLARYVDHRPLADIGLRLDHSWLSDLIYGLLLGAGLMTLIFLLQLSLGWITITAYRHTTLANTPFGIAIWQPIFLFIAVGINEELSLAQSGGRHHQRLYHAPKCGDYRLGAFVAHLWLPPHSQPQQHLGEHRCSYAGRHLSRPGLCLDRALRLADWPAYHLEFFPR